MLWSAPSAAAATAAASSDHWAAPPLLTYALLCFPSRYGQLEDVWVSRAPTGPDCWAVVTFASPAAAQRAQAALSGQVLPAITERTLKVREWTERPERPWKAATRRQEGPAAPQQRWADAVDELALPQQLGSGWEAAMAAAEEEEEEEEEYEDDEDDEDDDEWGACVAR